MDEVVSCWLSTVVMETFLVDVFSSTWLRKQYACLSKMSSSSSNVCESNSEISADPKSMLSMYIWRGISRSTLEKDAH